MICVSVTENHIKSAKATPRNSPIALALIEIGFTDVCVTPHYAFIGNELYRLPEQAIDSERCFDLLVKTAQVRMRFWKIFFLVSLRFKLLLVWLIVAIGGNLYD